MATARLARALAYDMLVELGDDFARGKLVKRKSCSSADAGR